MSIERVHTTYSVYEINHETKQVRRAIGLNSPTANVGMDGVWQEYEAATFGSGGLLIAWPEGKAHPYTLTSPVTRREWVRA